MSDTSALPSEEKVRELTADPELTPEDARRYGNMFAEAGKYPQAISFCERTKDEEVLGRVKKEAIAAGDAFILHSITRLLPEFVTTPEWIECGHKAQSEGKLVFARDCFEKAGEEEKAKAVHEEWLKIFDGSDASADSADEKPADSAAPTAPQES